MPWTTANQRPTRHHLRHSFLILCCTLVLIVAGCGGGEARTSDGDRASNESPLTAGAVTLSPSHGSIHGGNIVMLGLPGSRNDLAGMEVEAQFGAAPGVPCEFDEAAGQFACRAPAHPDPVTVDVAVRADGRDVTGAVPYTYTTVGYGDMPVVTLDLSAIQRRATVISDDYPSDVKMGVVLKNGEPVGAMGKAIADAVHVDYFFVPKLSDAVSLREAGVTTPIVIMYLTDPADIPLLLRYDLETAATSAAWVERANQILEPTGSQLRVHLWIDTGFGREGVLPDEALPLAKAIDDSPHLKLQGIASHLCCVESTDLEALAANDLTTLTVLQKSRFDEAVAQIRGAGIGQDALLHIGASDVLANDLDSLYYDMLRVGGMYFVSRPDTPLYSWTARIDQVKTLPAGWCIDYGCETTTTEATKVGLVSHIPLRDGVIAFIVRGQQAPVLLNHSTVVTLDLSAIPDAAEGDEVTIQFNPENGQLLDTTLPVPVTLGAG